MCTRWSGKTGLYYTEYLYTQSSGHQLGDVYDSSWYFTKLTISYRSEIPDSHHFWPNFSINHVRKSFTILLWNIFTTCNYVMCVHRSVLWNLRSLCRSKPNKMLDPTVKCPKKIQKDTVYINDHYNSKWPPSQDNIPT